jgi:hypothetical protein
MGSNIEGKSSSSRARAAGWAKQPPGSSPRRAQVLCWVHGAPIAGCNQRQPYTIFGKFALQIINGVWKWAILSVGSITF